MRKFSTFSSRSLRLRGLWLAVVLSWLCVQALGYCHRIDHAGHSDGQTLASSLLPDHPLHGELCILLDGVAAGDLHTTTSFFTAQPSLPPQFNHVLIITQPQLAPVWRLPARAPPLHLA